MSNRTSVRTLAFAAMNIAATAGLAAPESYTFSTGATVYVSATLPFSAFQPYLQGGASGTFFYDSAASFVQINPDGSSAYAGFTSPSITGLTPSVSGLSASFNFNPGLSFSDPNGSTSVWNDKAVNFFGSGDPGGDALLHGPQALDQLGRPVDLVVERDHRDPQGKPVEIDVGWPVLADVALEVADLLLHPGTLAELLGRAVDGDSRLVGLRAAAEVGGDVGGGIGAAG